ncbi:hypothetical protein ACX53_02455 [Loigolactobacillus backii]|nr:hypothetical protein ACX53_02455 [Loigolactobacillus backii]
MKRQINWRQLGVGILAFLVAVLLGYAIIYRLTHRGHFGIGPFRLLRLGVLMVIALSFGIRQIQNSLNK